MRAGTLFGSCLVLRNACLAVGTVWQFLRKLNVELSCDPAISLLSINTCTYMFIVAVFKIANRWKCLSMDEWINKLWYIYAMKYYSAIKEVICSMNESQKYYAK